LLKNTKLTKYFNSNSNSEEEKLLSVMRTAIFHYRGESWPPRGVQLHDWWLHGWGHSVSDVYALSNRSYRLYWSLWLMPLRRSMSVAFTGIPCKLSVAIMHYLSEYKRRSSLSGSYSASFRV